jgi:N-acetylglucosaminyl-diphospho-decaprenol L-rhamnosyltransferase
MTVSEALSSVSVLIVTYNSSRTIIGCLDGLETCGVHEILVADNASEDETCRLVADHTAGAVLTARSDNSGFAIAMNELAQRASGQVLLLLNPDCFVNGEDLMEATARLLVSPRSGIASPLVADLDGRPTKSAGWQPNWWRLPIHSILGAGPGVVRSRFGLYTTPKGESNRRVEWVGGACMLVRADVWRQLGGLSERWFMYSEDLDLCARAGASGWQVHSYEDLRVQHIGGASHHPGSVNTFWLTNLIDYYAGCGPFRAIRTRYAALWLALAFSLRSLTSSVVIRRDAYKLFAERIYARHALGVLLRGIEH